MNSIRELYQAAPGLVVAVGALLLVAAGLRHRRLRRRPASSVEDWKRMDQHAVDKAFNDIVGALDPLPNLTGADHRDDQERIASVVLASSGIHPSVVSFAKHRVALHWGIDEETIDIAVTAFLLQAASREITRRRSEPA